MNFAKSIAKTLKRIYTWFVKFMFWFAVIILVLWLLYPSLQFLALKSLNLSDDVDIDIKISNINFSYEDKHLFINLPRLELYDKQHLKLLGTIQDIQADISIVDLFQKDKSFLTVLVKSIFFDVDQILKWNPTQGNQDWNHLLNFIRTISIEKILVKFQKRLLPSIYANYEHNKITFAPFTYSLNHLEWFDYSVPIQISSNIHFLSDTDFEINLLVNNNDIQATTTIIITDNQYQINTQIDKLDAEKISTYLPTKLLTNNLNSWLNQAFVKGLFFDLKLNWSKYHHRPAIFKTQAKFKNLSLLFREQWPVLKYANGTMSSHDYRIDIDANNGQLEGIQLNNIEVDIIDIDQPTPVLLANINTSNTTQKSLDFLKIDAIQSLVPPLGFLKFDGQSKTEVFLNIPLVDLDDDSNINVAVSNTFITNQLYLPNINAKVDTVDVQLVLSNNELLITGSANYDNQPFFLDFKKQDDKFQLYFFDKQSNATLTTSYHDNLADLTWRIQINKPSVSLEGIVKTDWINNHFNVHIDQANIQSSLSFKTDSFDLTYKDMPSMKLTTDKVVINQYKIASASLDLIPNDNQSHLTGDLIFDSKLAVGVIGDWYDYKTVLNLDLSGQSLGQLLDLFQSKDIVKNGAFNAKVNLFCHCNPWELSSHEGLYGNSTISVGSGVLTKQDASFGRILSLLNIRALTKRLSLDTSDAFNQGFAYKSIEASAMFAHNTIDIKSFNLSSFASEIQLSGGINLQNKKLDLSAKVIPSLSDSVPLISALSGGGLAGLGVWLIDKAAFDGEILDNLLNNTTAFEYQVGGVLDEPIIK